MLLCPSPQDGSDFEVVPGSEFTVARTATRSNGSDYYVNGKKTAVKDVGGAGCGCVCGDPYVRV
jgi:chromosome segregation ATPase